MDSPPICIPSPAAGGWSAGAGGGSDLSTGESATAGASGACGLAGSLPGGSGGGSAAQPSAVTLESASANVAGLIRFMWLVLAGTTGQNSSGDPCRQQEYAGAREARGLDLSGAFCLDPQAQGRA